MTSRKRRKKQSIFTDIVSLLASVAMIVIAVLLVVFVYFYIKNNSLSEFLPFGSKSEKESVTQSAKGDPKESTKADEQEEEDSKLGLFHQENGKLVYILDQDEMRLYDKENQLPYEDGQRILANSWLESGDYLYYFGTDGCAVSEYSEGAMQYDFDSNYVLDSIRYNESYAGDAESENAGYPGLVVSKTLWAYVNESKTAGDLYAIRYKTTLDSLTFELGGGSNPQYTSKYAMAISDGYIYYLAVADSEDKVIEAIANKLFRMKPGTDFREVVAENVKGYKILAPASGYGDAKVYYDDGSAVRVAGIAEKDESMRIFPEDGNYYVGISEGKAILMLEGGYPVTMESSSFRAGNFYYSIDSSGAIRSVASKTSVSTGGYTYFVENGEAFGVDRARVMRKNNSNGTIEVISAEFIGEVGNIHYDYGTSRMIAEYKDVNGAAGLLSISTDGDVDTLIDAEQVGGVAELYGISGGEAIIRTPEYSEPFKKVRLSATYPLTVGIDPIVLEEDDPGTETEAETAAGPESAVEVSTAETTAVIKPTKESSQSSGGAVVSDGPGSGAEASAGTSSQAPAETSAEAGSGSSSEAEIANAPDGDSAEVGIGAAPGVINSYVEKKGPGE